MNTEEVVILVAEDDAGHATLMEKNLKRAGLKNKFLHFKDGQEILDFLFNKGGKEHHTPNTSCILLLDIRMPRVDGVGVLQRIKQDKELRRIPVIMVTTTDDPREVENCHRLGCNIYITKPVDYDSFVEAIRKLGLFLTVAQLPKCSNSQ